MGLRSGVLSRREVHPTNSWNYGCPKLSAIRTQPTSGITGYFFLLGTGMPPPTSGITRSRRSPGASPNQHVELRHFRTPTTSLDYGVCRQYTRGGTQPSRGITGALAVFVIYTQPARGITGTSQLNSKFHTSTIQWDYEVVHSPDAMRSPTNKWNYGYAICVGGAP